MAFGDTRSSTASLAIIISVASSCVLEYAFSVQRREYTLRPWCIPGQKVKLTIVYVLCLFLNTISSVLLYSTSTPVSDEIVGHVDANTYKPFKKIDTAVIKTIMNEFEKLSVSEEECKLRYLSLFYCSSSLPKFPLAWWGP